MLLLEVARGKNFTACKDFKAVKCPVQEALAALGARRPRSVVETSGTLYHSGLQPINSNYGEGLNERQLREASRNIVTAGCPNSKGCRVLVRDGETSIGSKVIKTTWLIDALIKNEEPRTVVI